ncbi:calcium-binding protein [Nocardioides sp. MH1]|uniref:calcium-binding protein n=1 Tax=Nocardioides sp. MH1 TaxID=3242490 RepID=UPI00352277A3
MIRCVAALALTVPALLVATTPADAAGPATCGGHRVTIDLDDAHHPDPNRARSDVVLGTTKADKITTGRGNDIVCGGRGHDLIDLGPGDDTAYGGKGGAVLNGGPGDDRLVGDPRTYNTAADFRLAPRGVRVDLRRTVPQETGWGRDSFTGIANVLGSAHDDVLRTRVLSGPTDSWRRHALLSGGAGDDRLFGSRASNRFLGGPGDDVMRGGGGSDRFDEYLSEENGGADTVYGGSGPDILEAANAGDHYEGGAGDDELTSAECRPTCEEGLVELYGGPGDDQFTLDENDELVDGGDGVDQVEDNFYTDAEGAVLTVDLAIVGPQDTGVGGTDDLSSIEDLIGNAYFDSHLFGNDDANTLVSYGNNDVLEGRGGDDVLEAGSGDDSLSGGDGSDSCDGSYGTDQFTDCEEILDSRGSGDKVPVSR